MEPERLDLRKKGKTDQGYFHSVTVVEHQPLKYQVALTMDGFQVTFGLVRPLFVFLVLTLGISCSNKEQRNRSLLTAVQK